MKKRLMLVDDDGFSAVHLEGLLADLFEVEYFSNAREALESALKAPPDIVLMDVEMPEMDGFAACRELRNAPATRDVPIVFLSAHGEAENRLAGYEAGGDDYVSKPFNPGELRRKIELLLRNREKNRELAAHAQAAANAAMAAMASAGDVGTVLNFLRGIVALTDLEQVAVAALDTLRRYELDAAIQLRYGGTAISRSSQGLCSPLEENILGTMATCARIVDLGSRSAFNYERVSLIINNMPRSDPEYYGRLKDSVIMIAEAVEIHLRSLDLVLAARQQGESLTRAVRHGIQAVQDMRHRQDKLNRRGLGIVTELANRMEDAFLSLVLTERQEAHMEGLMQQALSEAQSLEAEEQAVDQLGRSLLAALEESLNTVPKPKEAGELPPPPDEAVRIELF
ncbi:MAG: response regulator [Rhodocyclaceae bacterium]|nr:response regulator [Rhodocyclaceae bacterium]